MDEKRFQEYQNLIQELLNCPNGEEVQILNANPDLLDAGLVETMELFAEVFESRGNEKTANFLINIARQLAEALELSLTTPTSSPLPNTDSQQDFLLEVLQAIDDSNGNSQVVYPLLQENLDKLDDNFATFLRSWVMASLPQIESELAQAFADGIVNFSFLIQEFPLGSIASNQEIAIAGYEVAATVFTREAFPQNWAASQNNLAIAYSKRIKGDRAENLEAAIAHYHAALQVYTNEAFPTDWAEIQNNLSYAYYDKIKGDMDENRVQEYLNLIQALLNCSSEEQVLILNANPDLVDAELVETMEHVAEMLELRGDENAADFLIDVARQLTETLESSSTPTSSPLPNTDSQQNFLLELLQATNESDGDLQTLYPWLQGNLDKLDDNFATFLRSWATAILPQVDSELAQTIAELIYNFSSLIWQFPLGSVTSNLEIALAGYEGAANVFTREASPQYWAKAQHNLATAYNYRIKGDRAENLEAAILYYTQALQVSTPEAFPTDWAKTKNSLAIAYYYRIKGDKAENLEAAIGCYSAALQVRTRHAFPQHWAINQNNLGNAYLDRIKGDKAENLEAAIGYFIAAVQVRTRQAFPQDWAMTQNNLGNAYRARIKGDKRQNLEKAIGYYQNALEIYTRDALPQNHAQTLFTAIFMYLDHTLVSSFLPLRLCAFA